MQDGVGFSLSLAPYLSLPLPTCLSEVIRPPSQNLFGAALMQIRSQIGSELPVRDSKSCWRVITNKCLLFPLTTSLVGFFMI